MVHIVLVEPEIPQNCGNIARTCAATGSTLHLIEPLGFDISEKAVRRAGLDYWHLVDVRTYPGLEDFFQRNPQAAENLWLATTKAPRAYSEAVFTEGSGCSSERKRRVSPGISGSGIGSGASACPCAPRPAASISATPWRCWPTRPCGSKDFRGLPAGERWRRSGMDQMGVPILSFNMCADCWTDYWKTDRRNLYELQ